MRVNIFPWSSEFKAEGHSVWWWTEHATEKKTRGYIGCALWKLHGLQASRQLYLIADNPKSLINLDENYSLQRITWRFCPTLEMDGRRKNCSYKVVTTSNSRLCLAELPPYKNHLGSRQQHGRLTRKPEWRTGLDRSSSPSCETGIMMLPTLQMRKLAQRPLTAPGQMLLKQGENPGSILFHTVQNKKTNPINFEKCYYKIRHRVIYH